MTVMGLSLEEQAEVLRVVAAILHLSNVTFVEEGNDAQVEDPECEHLFLEFIYLLLFFLQLFFM